MSKPLNRDFLLEFYRCSMANASVLETGREHLKPQYLPDQIHKKIWKFILDHYSVQGRPPSLGILAQLATDNTDVLGLISDIKAVGMPNTDDLFEQLEEYILNAKFQVSYDKLYETFTKGDKKKARGLLKEYGDDMASFSLKGQYFDKVFAGFDNRMLDRDNVSLNPTDINNNFRVPFGIPELDFLSRGGMSATDVACFMAQSGVGKSRVLRHVGVHAARLGYKVAHFQLEGSKKECMDQYDAVWTDVMMQHLEQGIVTEKQRKRINKTINDMEHGIGGEIFVEAFETFNSASMLDIRNSLIELEKLHGKMHLVIIDYLEKADPGDGKKYSVEHEKQRREAVAQKMKNIAVEFQTRVLTATQAHGIDPKLLNNPEFVMDRYNTSMGKNLLDPFSFFISMNQTEDEYKGKIMRLFNDKLRNYKSKQKIYIAQDYNRSKFVDFAETSRQFFRP